MSAVEALALAAAAAAAGAINAVAGGGTLITFPALLFFGTPPVVANATSTAALVVGTAGSLFGFRRQLAAIRPWLVRFVPVSALGGWLGSYFLTRTSDRLFMRQVPYLILFATVLFMAQGAFRKLARVERELPGRIGGSNGLFAAAMLFQFAVSIYGGYFGAGIGILMLASLGLLGWHDIHEMNALKTALSSLINLVAAAWFVASGLVDWGKMAVMIVGALLGYYLGAHYSQKIPQIWVRRLITTIGFVIAAIMFLRMRRI